MKGAPGPDPKVQQMWPSDAELARGAQSGEIGCLGILLARHQATMRAVALSVLGYRHDVDDAVQEASITALLRIADLRDPEAVGGWLRAIVRNQCLMQLRARTDLASDDLETLTQASHELDPAEILDRHALGNWVWQALDDLTPTLHLVTLLRYFTSVTSYEQIATVCAIPVGTVRSRLNQARTQLAEGLSAATDTAHNDVLTLTEGHRQEAAHTLDAAHQGSFGQALANRWSPGVETFWPWGTRTKGVDHLVRLMDSDLTDGVSHRLANVVASQDIVIWETDLISPADDPFHCPPAALWLQYRPGGRVQRLRVFHPVPNPVPSTVAATGTPMKRGTS